MAAGTEHSGLFFVGKRIKEHADGKSAELFVNGERTSAQRLFRYHFFLSLPKMQGRKAVQTSDDRSSPAQHGNV
jgi:hypothetical protein